MDGKSRDDSVEIIRHYEGCVTHWCSEPDGGQADAINKGFALATGDILAFINSDDWYQPGAFAAVAGFFTANSGLDWLIAGVDNCDEQGNVCDHYIPFETSFLDCLGRQNYGFHQPGMFWSRDMIERVGPFDTRLSHAFDHEFWCRALFAGVRPLCVSVPVAFFRRHESSKTGSDPWQFRVESWQVYDCFRDRLSRADRRKVKSDLRRWQVVGFARTVYTALRSRGRMRALRILAHYVYLIPRIRPRKMFWGALLRILTTGRPPAWFNQ